MLESTNQAHRIVSKELRVLTAALRDKESLLAQRAIPSRVDSTYDTPQLQPHVGTGGGVTLEILGVGSAILQPHTDGALDLPIPEETESLESSPNVSSVGEGEFWECFTAPYGWGIGPSSSCGIGINGADH